MLNRQRQNHSLHWKMKVTNFRFFFVQSWFSLEFDYNDDKFVCTRDFSSLYIKSSRLRWVFIQLLCNYELFKADLSRRCSSYDILKTCMKVFSYRSSCVLHSEKRQQHVNSKQGECLTSLFIFWKKILSNILIKWESGYDIIWGQVRVQNNEKRKEVELKDMKNVWREEVKEEKLGTTLFAATSCICNCVINNSCRKLMRGGPISPGCQ